MNSESELSKALELTEKVLSLTSGMDFKSENLWTATLVVGLSRAGKRLDSIRELLLRNDYDSSEILARSLFEIAANLAYIAVDVDERLPAYLRHGGVPTTKAEAEELLEEIKNDVQPKVKDMVPGRAWKSLKDMCIDLGEPWLSEYDTLYRVTSEQAHSGAFTLGENYTQLLNNEEPSEHKKAVVLVTALDMHIRIARVAASVFPEQIDDETLAKLQAELPKILT